MRFVHDLWFKRCPTLSAQGPQIATSCFEARSGRLHITTVDGLNVSLLPTAQRPIPSRSCGVGSAAQGSRCTTPPVRHRADATRSRASCHLDRRRLSSP